MKRISLLLVIFITSVFISSSNLSQAQDIPPCLNGWNTGERTVFGVVMPNGFTCDITVYYCWKIDGGEFEFYMRAVGIHDSDCLDGVDLTDPEFWDKFAELIIQHHASQGHISAPNCRFGYDTLVRMEKESCWKYITLQGGSDVVLVPCDDEKGLCPTEYAICWDYSYQPPRLEIQRLDNQYPVSVPCYDEMIFDPEVPVSDCFITCHYLMGF